MKDVLVHVLYCDDIRLEMGAKQSFMGVYSAEMLVPALPTALPKLCAYVELNLPSSLDLESVGLTCKLNDAELSRMDLPKEDIPQIQKSLVGMQEDENWLVISVSFMFSPLLVSEAGKITVSAFINGREHKGNALRIRAQTEDEKKLMAGISGIA